MIIRVTKSTIVQPFKAGVLCFKALSLCDESLHPVKNQVNLCPQLLNFIRALTVETFASAVSAIANTPKDGDNVFLH